MNKAKGKNSIQTFGLIIVATVALALIPTLAWAPPDSDGDGVADNRDDCPGTPPCSLIDGNGCPISYDLDCDSYYDDVDCDDTDATINSDATEVCGDGLDNDCNDNIDQAGVSEVCGDGIDNNCDGSIDEGCGGGIVDTDGDGLYDTTEQAGLTLTADITLLSRDGTTPATVACTDAGGAPATCYRLPPCTSGLAPDDPARALCVDWQTPELFVFMHRAGGCSDPDCLPLYDNDGSGTAETNLPISPPYSGSTTRPYFDKFAIISAPQGARNTGGLGVAVHEGIQVATSTNQHITDNAYAVRATEDLTIGGGYLGISTPGVPGPSAGLIIWTENVKRSIYKKCTMTTIDGVTYDVDECTDSVSGQTITGLAGLSYADSQTKLGLFYRNYITNILCHELGHTVNLVPAITHFSSGAGVVMEIKIDADATKRKNDAYAKSILYISEDYHEDSKASFSLQ